MISQNDDAKKYDRRYGRFLGLLVYWLLVVYVVACGVLSLVPQVFDVENKNGAADCGCDAKVNKNGR